MGIFDFFRTADINQGVERYRKTPNAVLLDVRTRQEYNERRIPGSRNVPLQEIDKVTSLAADKSMPLFVHCLSGGRSRQAVAALRQMGYTQVENIGGISSYRGKVEK